MGYETIVRPVVLPNIRPTPKQRASPPPSDDGGSDKGKCVIRGSSGKIVQLPYSYSASSSSNNNRETKRRVDEVRVYQEEDDGTINRDNFVDIEVANKIWKKGGNRPAVDTSGAGSGTPGVGSGTSGVGNSLPDSWFEEYRKTEEAKNIEIRKRDQIKRTVPGAT